MKTNVYVDAFNLYYGCLKDTPNKWLDIRLYCAKQFPSNSINAVHVFAARVSDTPTDQKKTERQSAYLRALEASGCILRLGQFLTSHIRMPLANPVPGQSRTVEVIKSEEKGSDVNIATQMMLDACAGDCEAMIVITNDSDLTFPISQVRRRFRIPVVVVHPCQGRRRPSIELKKASSKSVLVDQALLAACQFPQTLTDDAGTITKPSTW